MDDAVLVKVLRALADPKRLRMTQEIAAAGELSCGQLAERFDVSQPTISHHLRILKEAEVLLVREAGQHRFISVNRKLIRDLGRFLPLGALASTPPGRRPRLVTKTRSHASIQR
ncbi:MAG TPA: metalloregulator ArsR/SmtB family transcription factor [Vicinamibacterales bacterium]|nr:metalloregulator ArsR/SmtB family transcription factor [Vicinamibacterales bacterium]